jgi:hypothetical protein
MCIEIFIQFGLEMSGQFHVPAALPPVPNGYEAGWAPEAVWTTWRRENSWPYRDANSDPSVVQPVASRYTDYSFPASQFLVKYSKYTYKFC